MIINQPSAHCFPRQKHLRVQGGGNSQLEDVNIAQRDVDGGARQVNRLRWWVTKATKSSELVKFRLHARPARTIPEKTSKISL